MHNRPSITARGAKSSYPTTHSTLKGIKNSNRWRGNARAGARPLHPDEVRKIMQAPINNLDDLRHKITAHCFFHMGFHKIDIYRLRDSMLEDHPHYKHRDGLLKPKIIIRGIHNKRPGISVRNIVACGCDGNHKPDNAYCEYAIWKLYMKTKQRCDDEYQRDNFKRMNNTKKAAHFVGGKMGDEGILKEINFLRDVNKTKDKYFHRNMGASEIANSLQYWNIKLSLRKDEKLTSDMARKTFCTLGEKFFKFDRKALRSISHHLTEDNFEVYVCEDYEDWEEESHVTETMQKWAQEKYTPPVHTTAPVMLSNITQSLKLQNKLTMRLMAMVQHQQMILAGLLNQNAAKNNVYKPTRPKKKPKYSNTPEQPTKQQLELMKKHVVQTKTKHPTKKQLDLMKMHLVEEKPKEETKQEELEEAQEPQPIQVF